MFHCEHSLYSLFLAVIVFTGVYPKPMLERIEPAVESLIAHVEDKADYESPEPAHVAVVDEHGEDG